MPRLQHVCPPPAAGGAMERCRAMLQCNTQHCCCFCGYNVTAPRTETQLKKSPIRWVDLRRGKCVFLFSRKIPSAATVARWLDCSVSSLCGCPGSSLCGLLDAEARGVECVCVGLERVSMRLLLLLWAALRSSASALFTNNIHWQNWTPLELFMTVRKDMSLCWGLGTTITIKMLSYFVYLHKRTFEVLF